MGFSLSQQTAYFLASIALGAAMAMLYDLIRAVRMLIRCSHGHIILSDILFFFVCGVLTSLFALPFNRGGVRVFIFFGETVGFLTYRLTLGNVFGRIYSAFARHLRRFFQKICEKLKKFYDFLLKAAAFLLYNIVESIEGVFRTAVSGVGMLISERRTVRLRRRVSRAKDRPVRIRTVGTDDAHTAYYPIPLFGDRDDRLRNENESKRSETRNKRQVRRKIKSQHRR